MQPLFIQKLKQVYKELLALDDPRAELCAEHVMNSLKEFKKPPRILISGETNAGKSHLLNQLIPEIELPTENMPATALCTVIAYGSALQTYAVSSQGVKKRMSLSEINDYVLQSKREMTTATDLRNVDHILIEVPNELLQHVTLIDTPGLNSTNAAHTAATERFYPKADGAIWVFSGSSGVNSSTENRDIQKLRSFNIDVLGVVNKMLIPIEASYDDDPERFSQLSYTDVQNILIDEWKKRYEEVGLVDLIGIDSKLAEEATERTRNDADWQDSHYDVLIEKIKRFTLPKKEQKRIFDALFQRLRAATTHKPNVKITKPAAQRIDEDMVEAYVAYMNALQQFIQQQSNPQKYANEATFLSTFTKNCTTFIQTYASFDSNVTEQASALLKTFERQLKRIHKIYALSERVLSLSLIHI